MRHIHEKFHFLTALACKGSVTRMQVRASRDVCEHVVAAAVDQDWSIYTVCMEITQRCDGGAHEGPGSSSVY